MNQGPIQLASPRAAAGFALLLALAACATPEKSRPAASAGPSLPVSFDGHLPACQATPDNPRPGEWWTAFHDATLDRLVHEALTSNEDILIADARLREAEADSAVAATGNELTVDAVAEYRRQHLPPTDRNKDPLVNQYAITGIAASWEADLFGRVRHLADAARAGVQANQAARDDVALAVSTTLARSYLDYRGTQSALVLSQRIRALTAEEAAGIRRRLAAGVATKPELAEAELRLAARDADIAEIERNQALALHRLSVITAQPLDRLRAWLAPAQEPVPEPACPPLASPAGLLRQRADIRRAESELVAARAIDDASRADLLPRLTFSGQFSFFAFGWGVGPNLQWDLFDRSRVKAREARAGAQADAAFVRYQRTVREAVAEVEDALSDLAAALQRRDSLKAETAQADLLLEAARKRAAVGLANRLEIAAAELAVAHASLDLDGQETAVLRAWVGLFAALGG